VSPGLLQARYASRCPTNSSTSPKDNAEVIVLFVLATFPPEGRESCSPVLFAFPGATPGESVPKVMTTGKTPAHNAEGDDDGKNHRYAENHVFR